MINHTTEKYLCQEQKKTLENQGFKRVKKWGVLIPPLSDSFLYLIFHLVHSILINKSQDDTLSERGVRVSS